MITVVIESPLSGAAFADHHIGCRSASWSFARRWLWSLCERFERARNKRYARACMRDSLGRGEAPYASHLLYDQPGILDDGNDAQRLRGMHAGFAHGACFEMRAVYIDRGVSSGMEAGMREAVRLGQRVERRNLFV